MYLRIILMLCFCSALSLFADDACKDSSSCAVPDGGAGGRYRVYIPVGVKRGQEIRQVPRLKSLSGKRVAIVGGSFMARVTHPELKRLLQRDYPGIEIFLLNEIGSAGVWPGPGVVRKQKDDFIANLKKFKIDAVISGNGGCGLCTPREMGSCIAAEYSGIPAVMIAAPGFTEQAEFTAKTAGVPCPQIAVYPGAFSAHKQDELLKNTREVLYPQIIKALTGTLERKNSEKDKKQLFFSGNLAEINQIFAENSWSDGLPIVPPTAELVDEFLKFTDSAADEVVAVVPPSYREVTVRLVAINGVMSGCPPEFMPILIAFAKAMTNGDFRRTLASTHAWTPYCWINGPVSRQLGIEFSQGVISHQRNALIGRFINLAMLNFGGYYIHRNRMGSFGYLMPWCLAEDEKTVLRLGWKPYHMQMGFSLNESTLTAASALNWGNNLAPATADPEKIMQLLAMDAVEKQQFALGSGMPFVYRTVMITGSVAGDLAKKYTSKNALEDAMVATALTPVYRRAYANYWANPGSAFDPEVYSLRRHTYRISRKEGAAVMPITDEWKWLKEDKLEMVPVMKTGKTVFLVTGDENRNKSMILPGGGSVTVKIELPAKWDEFMQTRGYAPLKSFYLKSSLQPEKISRKYSDYRNRRSR